MRCIKFLSDRLLIVLLLALGLGACKPEPPGPDPNLQEIELAVPAHFPKPEIPADNPLTPAKISLGRKLFYDPLLSQDRSISCGSCHQAASGFSDPRRLSRGVNNALGIRNSMPIMNLVYARSFFWDGSNPSLETQALFPIEAHFEMNNRVDTVIRRLRASAEYRALFAYTYGDTALTVRRLTDALASFQRSMLSYGSKFDRFMERGMDSAVFSPQEWRGYQLFFMERNGAHAECFHCHGGFNFDDPSGSFRNNGLYEYYEDQGRYEVTGNPLDIGKFKVPSLRNIEFTAPYMHDGSMATLEEVLDHYGSGGKPHPNRDVLIGNILLSEEEKADIIAFLRTLSDPGFLSNPAFLPE